MRSPRSSACSVGAAVVLRGATGRRPSSLRFPRWLLILPCFDIGRASPAGLSGHGGRRRGRLGHCVAGAPAASATAAGESLAQGAFRMLFVDVTGGDATG